MLRAAFIDSGRGVVIILLPAAICQHILSELSGDYGDRSHREITVLRNQPKAPVRLLARLYSTKRSICPANTEEERAPGIALKLCNESSSGMVLRFKEGRRKRASYAGNGNGTKNRHLAVFY
jgi:hypothetical protein